MFTPPTNSPDDEVGFISSLDPAWRADQIEGERKLLLASGSLERHPVDAWLEGWTSYSHEAELRLPAPIRDDRGPTVTIGDYLGDTPTIWKLRPLLPRDHARIAIAAGKAARNFDAPDSQDWIFDTIERGLVAVKNFGDVSIGFDDSGLVDEHTIALIKRAHRDLPTTIASAIHNLTARGGCAPGKP